MCLCYAVWSNLLSHSVMSHPCLPSRRNDRCSDVASRYYDSYLGLPLDFLGVAKGLPRDSQRAALELPRNCRAIGLGFARDRRIAFRLPWGCLGFCQWLALGLARG